MAIRNRTFQVWSILGPLKTEVKYMERFSFQTEIHGAGGFAKVIHGKDNTLDRDIAVKVLSPLLDQSSEPDKERFRREARTLAKNVASQHSGYL